MTPVRLGLIALPWWTAFGVFLFLDLYLRYPVAASALRLLMPLALLCNLAGIAMVSGESAATAAGRSWWGWS